MQLLIAAKNKEKITLKLDCTKEGQLYGKLN